MTVNRRLTISRWTALHLVAFASLNALLLPVSYLGAITWRQLAYDRAQNYPPAIWWPTNFESLVAGIKLLYIPALFLMLLIAINYVWLAAAFLMTRGKYKAIALITSLCIVIFFASYGYSVWRPMELPPIHYPP